MRVGVVSFGATPRTGTAMPGAPAAKLSTLNVALRPLLVSRFLQCLPKLLHRKCMSRNSVLPCLFPASLLPCCSRTPAGRWHESTVWAPRDSVPGDLGHGELQNLLPATLQQVAGLCCAKRTVPLLSAGSRGLYWLLFRQLCNSGMPTAGPKWAWQGCAKCCSCLR